LKFADRLLAGSLRGAWGGSAGTLIFAGGEVFAAVDHRQVRHHDAEVRRGFFAGFSGAVLTARPFVHERRAAVRRVVLRARLVLRVRLLSAGVTGVGVARVGVCRIVFCACTGGLPGNAGLLAFTLPCVFVRAEEGLAGARGEQGEQEQHDHDRKEPPPRVYAASSRALGSVHRFLPFAPV
jgi:hypothetical protein